MNLWNKLHEERGQGLVEYTFIVLFVALVLWIGVKGTNAGDVLTDHWNTITDCVAVLFLVARDRKVSLGQEQLNCP
jgi:Flp pilus assembly pilin Flp